MYPIPTGTDSVGNAVLFSEILGRDHQMKITNQIENGDGDVLSQQFGILGGDVTIDRTAQFRRSCKIEVAPYGAPGELTAVEDIQQMSETLIPKDGNDAFAPYGNKIRLWYNIQVIGYTNLIDGSQMYPFSLGVFRISTVDIDDSGVPKLIIMAYDESRTISRNKLATPWIVAAGTNYGDAIIALCQDRLPGLQAKPHTITTTTPQIILDPESDPWKSVTEWAAACGSVVYLDRDGYLTIQDEPDPETDPVVWTYDDGGSNPNAVLLSVGRGMSDEPGYNGIIMTSESNTLASPIRVELWDDDPDSPTFARGPYGKIPYFESNPLLVDSTQASAAAAAKLLQIMGGTESVTFGAVPNPAHEPGDVVRVIRPLSLTDSTAVIDSLVIPLDAGNAMTVRTRERRSAFQTGLS